MNDCVFCKISDKKIPTKFDYVSKSVLAFPDVHPIAPVHILIIPREHIASVNDIMQEHGDVIAEMFLAAKKIAREKDIADSGYKLLIRTGSDGGQEVPHIHLHLIGGSPLTEDIHPL